MHIKMTRFDEQKYGCNVLITIYTEMVLIEDNFNRVIVCGKKHTNYFIQDKQ